ncbi:Hydroxypyruvate reductase [Emticicia aquatica]|jgi:D-3-phosphoglycerate dehydrogenase|uniref:Hydroxypyruvate reductase n=2 Tax=Emticicia aquatica TaxID=1681835 RepID=A0ABN8EYD4_9BACT|nr:Hydroxypyruvate reductase [Emticicia aquatica]
MLKRIDEFRHIFEAKGVEIHIPNMVQTLSEEELITLLPEFDGWIIGDDPATERVFEAGKKGLLKAAVKWGVGVDNVDFKACEKLGIPIINTPQMFGAEVANIAVGYVIGLARELFLIDQEVKKGNWIKPSGMSLKDKKVGVIGFGDIGKHTAKYLKGLEMDVIVYDPFAKKTEEEEKLFSFLDFPENIEELDFLVATCALTPSTKNMVNMSIFERMKIGVRIVNVSRGGIINEKDLVDAMNKGIVYSAALDVFETEPLPQGNALRQFERCVFGTHNGSNTIEGVRRASHQAIEHLFNFLKL